MSKTFVISDTHFGHSNILKFESFYRPFETIAEHDEWLVKKWNEVVTTKDTVYHLGDVLFGKHSFSILPRLHGNKKLVMGNHDMYPISEYAKHFTKIMPYATLSGCILSHIPVHPQQLYRYKLNIHGHLHSNSIDDPRYKCVSVEHTDLRPVDLQQILDELKD